MAADPGAHGGPTDAGPPRASVQTDVDDDRSRVVVVGDFDAATSPAAVDAALAVWGGRQLTAVTIDMSDAGFVDSTGLGSLVRLRAEARRRGARTTLVGLDPRLEKLLRLTGLDQEFTGR